MLFPSSQLSASKCFAVLPFPSSAFRIDQQHLNKLTGYSLYRQPPCGPGRKHGWDGKNEVSRAGGQGVALVKKLGLGPLDTMVGAAKLQVSRAGGQAACFQESL